ncbi:leishmanolysin-related zinc metalloendopeptidase [Deinococcus cellulosilyticus]|uniref:Peptidase n=1 Tax=Deinococcus cellulosilyticus (strain DSM 18568 / NBRC 106333 / KACC 11606 / 5516J-15) TaxID=1223518 RepID=A0A511NAJ7_DEIC1|nr:leishmanolysin-related zinc metalloendopeptidase [Deinococcus cellulosilyticus]GEM49597.1 peptidase [Deinococcus cellulosilyticus NBRC 106333 = KACC 11606]
MLLDAPSGLNLNVLTQGWTIPGSFPSGTTKNVTFSISFDVAENPAQDPFGFSLVTAISEEPSDPFDIDLDFSADTLLTTSQKAIFEQAASRWEQVITHGLSNINDGGTIYDDLVIKASAVAIDGVGGILGQAGPEFIRNSNSLPLSGIMQFDSADLSNMETSGILYNVILHEMGHVLGIGTLWDYLGFLTYNAADCQTSTSIVFNKANAIAQYNALGGAGSVPVEDTGGAGTKCGHWRESIFDTELMTGWAEAGSMPMSRMTIASLKDLGYSVNLAAADTYTLPGVGGIRQQSHDIELIEIPTRPRVIPDN